MNEINEQEVERIMHGVIGTQVEAIEDALEQAAMLHEQVDCASDAERLAGIPGAGAMGAVIEYRDRIRQLKARLTGADRCKHFKPSILGVPEAEDQCVKPEGHEGKHSLGERRPHSRLD